MHMKTNLCLLLYVFIPLLAPSLPAQAEKKSVLMVPLLSNGGFESGEPADFGALKDWDVFGNIGAMPVGFTKTKIGFAPSYVPRQGMRMVIFSAGNNDFGGTISQSFETVPGVTYAVRFAMGVTSESMGRKQAVQVSVADGDGALILTRIETIVSHGKGTTWKEFDAKFIAAGSRSRISIQDFSEILPLIETSNTDLVVDDVSVTGSKMHQAISKTGK